MYTYIQVYIYNVRVILHDVFSALSVREPPEWVGVLRDYQTPSPSGTCFLDGCRIFLAGFSEQELEKLHRIINLGGGARYIPYSQKLS